MSGLSENPQNKYANTISAIEFIITEQCNLRCKYCYVNHTPRIMSKDVIDKSLSWAFNQSRINFSSIDDLSIALFGGEPTLHSDLMVYIVEEAYKKALQTGITANFNVVTNATIMNKDIYNLIKRCIENDIQFTTQLSIDGYEEVQDANRPTRSGGSSWALIKDNIKYYLELYKNNRNLLAVHGVITKQSLPHLFETFRYYTEEMLIRNTWFMPLQTEMWSDDDVKMYDEQTEKIYEYVKDIIEKTKDINFLSIYCPIDKCIGLQLPNRKEKYCGAGVSFISIHPNGDIYPCHRFYEIDKSLKIGNVFDGNIDELKQAVFTQYDTLWVSPCNTCDHLSLCFVCTAVNYEMTGTMFSTVCQNTNYGKMMMIDRKYQYKMLEVIEKVKAENGQNN